MVPSTYWSELMPGNRETFQRSTIVFTLKIKLHLTLPQRRLLLLTAKEEQEEVQSHACFSQSMDFCLAMRFLLPAGVTLAFPEAPQVTAVFCRYKSTSSSQLPKYLANATNQSCPQGFVAMGSCEQGKWGSCGGGGAHTAFLGSTSCTSCSPSLSWDPSTEHQGPPCPTQLHCHVPWALQILFQGTVLKAGCSNCRRVAWCINLHWQKLLHH